MLHHPYIPGINPNRAWSIILICLWIPFASIFFSIFAPIFKSFLSCNIFVWLWYQGNDNLIKWVRKCSFICFGKSLNKIGVNSFDYYNLFFIDYRCLLFYPLCPPSPWPPSPTLEFTMKSSGHGVFFVESFFLNYRLNFFACLIFSFTWPSLSN